jgi:hypothetical protein
MGVKSIGGIARRKRSQAEPTMDGAGCSARRSDRGRVGCFWRSPLRLWPHRNAFTPRSCTPPPARRTVEVGRCCQSRCW